MQLTEAQAQQARQWINDGLKLSEFQRKIETEFGLRLTYMEARLLVDDLKVIPKDPEPEPVPPPPPVGSPPAESLLDPAAPATGGKVNVVVDAVTRPGTMASGSVTFSDGQTAQWYLDQTGRFGMVPPSKGYRPTPEDLQQFQVALDRELQRLGI